MDHNAQDRDAFNSIINEMALLDNFLVDQRFTWSNMRKNPYLAKLDRVLVSYTWEARFRFANAYSIPKPTSDHDPIYLDSGETRPSCLELKSGGWNTMWFII